MRSLAKRLLEPGLICPNHATGPDWVYTDGPAVAELCAAAGYAPDPQQQLGLDVIFAVDSHDMPTSFSFCVICARQNLKTGLFKQAAIGWMFLTMEDRVVWSAHEMSTTRDAHADLALLITECKDLSKYLPAGGNNGIYGANGQERIEFADGRTLKFKARTISGSRGLTGDKTILDEAFALKPSHVGALLPTMTARPKGQVIYGSSACKADSEVLFDVRDRGRAGSSPRMTYLEWLAKMEECRILDHSGRWVENPFCQHPKDAFFRDDIDCALDREHIIREANPTISTGRITVQTIRDMRQELPVGEYLRECLGQHDETEAAVESGVFGPGVWEACAGKPLEPVQVPAALGLAVSVGRDWASLAPAATVEVLVDPSDPESEPEEKIFVAAGDRAEGVGWLVPRLKEIQTKYPELVIIADEGGPVKDLRKDFEDNDIAIEWIGLDEVAEACSRFFDKVVQRRLLHPNSPELDDAVAGAEWRPVSDRQVWGRRKSARDVSMLEAGTLAVHGAEKYGSAFNIY